jgi:O-antigen ligase
MTQSFPNVRFSLVCFAAVAVSLPVAIVSIAKLLLFVGALVVILKGWRNPSYCATKSQGTSSRMVLAVLAIMAVSGLWSTGSTDDILVSLAKHGKLLEIPILLCLIRSRQEALVALAFFVAGQVFLLLSTGMMVAGIVIPWATSKEVGVSYAVFSSYLDQSIMTGILAALCWHMRDFAPTRYKTLMSLISSGLALVCVFFVFQGRTGHAVAIALLSIAIFWETPKKFRLAIAAVPIALTLLLAATSDKVHDGLLELRNAKAVYKSGDVPTSSGTRLELWRRSLQSIAENPMHGTGVGSWSNEFNRQRERIEPATHVKIAGNPHQEFLLWGVELGIGGMLIFCALLFSFYRDSRKFDQQTRRALQSVVVAVAIACMFNCTLYNAKIGDFFCIALGLLLALGAHAMTGTLAAPARAAPAWVGK